MHHRAEHACDGKRTGPDIVGRCLAEPVQILPVMRSGEHPMVQIAFGFTFALSSDR